MRNNKGITMVALIVTVAIMIILTVTITVNFGNFASRSNQAKFETDIKAIREEINQYYARNKELPILNKYTNTSMLNDIKNVNDNNNYYVVDLSKISVKLNFGSDYDIVKSKSTSEELSEILDIYIINERSHTIYNPKGVEYYDSINYTDINTYSEIEDVEMVYEVEERQIKVGDYVAYTPTSAIWDWSATVNGITYQKYSGSTNNTGTLTTEPLNWRILDIDKLTGEVTLISDVNTTSTSVYLSDFNGYNNGVYLLDEICKTLYSGNNGFARSLKREDIEDKLTYDYTQYANSFVDTGLYGGTKEYTSSGYRWYPEIFSREKTGTVNGVTGTEYDFSQQEAYITGEKSAGTSITITQTHWEKSMVASDFKDYDTNDNIYYKLFINDGSGTYTGYWLSSRSAKAISNYAYFNIGKVWTGKVTSTVMYGSIRSSFDNSGRIRPVVTLSSDVKINTTNSTKDGSTAKKAWELK